MNEETFISLLQRNDPQEILDIIRSNGSDIKLVNPFTYIDDIPEGYKDDSNMD